MVGRNNGPSTATTITVVLKIFDVYYIICCLLLLLLRVCFPTDFHNPCWICISFCAISHAFIILFTLPLPLLLHHVLLTLLHVLLIHLILGKKIILGKKELLSSSDSDRLISSLFILTIFYINSYIIFGIRVIKYIPCHSPLKRKSL